jgi:hypothetical protein
MTRYMAPVLAAIFATASYSDAPAGKIGFYHWRGQYTTSMSEGVERVASIGGSAVRVVISPWYYIDYNISSACYPNYSLSAIMSEPDVKRALDNPSVDVYMLTTYDGTTSSGCQTRFLNPSFYSAENTAALIEEYSDFTLYLEKTYQETHKRFIISEWEDDNMVYCQSAYYYAVDPQFRGDCDVNYSAKYGNSSPAESMEGLKLWLQARQQGIADGRNRAEALGIANVEVDFAPEFANSRSLHDAGLESVLYDVLPSVLSDYVSYSAYESINTPDAAGTLIADLNTIRDIAGSRAIIIGESGFDRVLCGSQSVARTDAVIRAALYAGVAYVFQWNVYDQDANDEYGLFDLDGNQTALGAYFQMMLSAQTPHHGSLITE